MTRFEEEGGLATGLLRGDMAGHTDHANFLSLTKTCPTGVSAQPRKHSAERQCHAPSNECTPRGYVGKSLARGLGSTTICMLSEWLARTVTSWKLTKEERTRMGPDVPGSVVHGRNMLRRGAGESLEAEVRDICAVQSKRIVKTSVETV